MDTSIPGCILEKNRWIGKAMFTASHESRSKDLKLSPPAALSNIAMTELLPQKVDQRPH
jgi:hypothetical protein